MTQGIARLESYIGALLEREQKPFYLVVDDALRAVSWQGPGQHYGFVELHPGRALEDELAILSAYEKSDGQLHQLRFVHRPDGVVAHLHVVTLADGWATAWIDATREHREQQQKQQAANELQLLREVREKLVLELEEANRLKSVFIAKMSHEFRTPLSSIVGYTELLQNQPNARHLGAVARNARYLSNLVENLLDQAHEGETVNLQVKACNLHDLALDVEEMFRPLADTRKLSLAWSFDPEVPARVWTDAGRLQQILINLVGNAVKFTRQGGVSIDFTWETDGRLGISVSDTGPGIPEQKQQKVFEPFAQGAHKGHAKGAGLGLTITHHLVTAMGGALALDSAPGAGTRVSFALPIARVVPGGHDGAQALAARSQGVSVLFAGDNLDHVELLRFYLDKSGIASSAVVDPGLLDEQVDAERPAAVLMDENFADGRVSEIARHLRERGYPGRIVRMCSRDEPPGAQDSLFDACWHKPLSRSNLLAALGELLDDGR